MKQWQKNAGWGFLAIVGLVLIVVGIQGRFGSLLAVALAPDQMVTPDTPPDVATALGPDQSSAA